MVAITTDSPRHQPPGHHPGTLPPLRLVASRQPAEPGVLISPILLTIVAVMVIIAVAVGTAALGRVLDGQRGIPAVSSPSVQQF